MFSVTILASFLWLLLFTIIKCIHVDGYSTINGRCAKLGLLCFIYTLAIGLAISGLYWNGNVHADGLLNACYPDSSFIYVPISVCILATMVFLIKVTSKMSPANSEQHLVSIEQNARPLLGKDPKTTRATYLSIRWRIAILVGFLVVVVATFVPLHWMPSFDSEFEKLALEKKIE
jgi:hypothetical protein